VITTRIRVAALAVTSLTLCAVACITGQAGGGGWAVVFFTLAAITADAAAHTHTQAATLRAACREIAHHTARRPFDPARGLARLRADLNRTEDQ
jgi:hypothetical protein